MLMICVCVNDVCVCVSDGKTAVLGVRGGPDGPVPSDVCGVHRLHRSVFHPNQRQG